MKIKFSHIFVLFILLAVSHFLAILFGLFQGRVWHDFPQHFLAGIALGLLWLWLLERRGIEPHSVHKLVLSGSLIGFVLLWGLIWELFEFSVYTLLPNFAKAFKLYSSNVADSLSDLSADLLGGLVVIAVKNRQSHKPCTDSREETQK